MIETWFSQDLRNAVQVRTICGNVFSLDNNGNKIGVRVTNNGEPVTLSGTIAANVIRADGATVAVAGDKNGNEAWVVLPQACYAVPGMITIIIKNTVESDVTTLCAVMGNVYQSSTDTAVDPGRLIEDVQALVATIESAIASLPTDYSSIVKDVQEINSVINGNTTYYGVQSQTGWAVTYITPSMEVKKDDYFIIDIDFESAPEDSTYIYLMNGDTEITHYQCEDLETKHITYKATADMNEFLLSTNSENYTGNIYAKVVRANRQTQVEQNKVTADEVAKEPYGYFTMQRLSPFIRGGYDYPDYNYNSYQVSSRDVMVAPFPMFMLVKSGFQALTLTIDGQNVTSSGWQSHSLYIPEGTSFVMKIQRATPDISEVADIETFVEAVTVYNDGAFPWHSIIDYADKFENSKNILYSTGAATSASGYFELYSFKNPQFRFVKIHSSVYARDLAEIAFYSSEEIDTDTYMQTYSQYAGSYNEDHYIYAEVPAGCKLMCVCSRNLLNNNDPFTPEVFVDNVDQYKNVELNNRITGISAFMDFKYVYHFGANDPTAAEVPPQSLFDIDIAHRLGFKAYELNVHKTATPGKYVCIHGSSGKIGNELVARNGTDISNIAFEDVTYTTFLEDYVYNTSKTQYRTHVTFLDEALAQCKKYGMIPLLSWADYDAVDYFNKYTAGRYILLIYNDYYIRRPNFKGAYNLYQSKTAAQLEEVLKKSGAPLYYSITNNELSLTDAELKELAELCHSYNSFIGFAGVYQTAAQNTHLLDIGFDYMSSGWEVEDFDSGNLVSIRSNGNFSDFSHEGSVSNETLMLASGKEIWKEPAGSAPILAKCSLKIRFSGTLIFNIGSYIYNTSITSDGSKDVVLTSAFFREVPAFHAKASGSVSVYSCVFDASVC